MDKYIFIITLIFFVFLLNRVKAEDDDEVDDDSISSKSDGDSKATIKTDVSGSARDGQIQQSSSENRNNNANNLSSTNDTNVSRNQVRNNTVNSSNSGSYNHNNNGNNSNNNGNSQSSQPRIPAQSSSFVAPSPVNNDVDPNMKDFRTGLSFGTLKILSQLPNCDQQTLLNYRRLLRTPSIRLQFYRDFYQLSQKNYVDGCGEGMVRIGHRERAILLRDPYFRKKVEKLMSRQPIGAAIRGPVHYPNDIGAGQQQGAKVLTLSKQY